MQESGATQRTQISAGTQARGQDIQRQTTLDVQAAQAESDDKRIAEVERGRREDRQFTEAMQKTSQVFQAKQAELHKEHQVAMVKGDRTYAETVREKQNALRRFEIEKQTAAQERSTNALLSIVKGSLQRESSREKAITVLNQEADKFDKDKDVYDRTVSRVVEKVSTDRRLDLPIKGEFVMKGKRVTPSMGFGAGYAQIPTLKPGTTADPMGILQDQLDSNQANVSVEQLVPEKINELEDSIQNGTTAAEDIRSALGVLEGMKDVLEQKRKDNPLSKDETAYDFWNDSYQTVLNMRDSVEGLANSQKKISNNEKETVGSRVQYALGVIRDSSLGGRAARLRELAGGNYAEVLEEMTKPLQIPSLWTVEPEMSDYEREIREEENAMLMRLYPDLGGIE
jgi:hypothetical protein